METNGWLTREMSVKTAIGYFDNFDENELAPEVLKEHPENPLLEQLAQKALAEQQAKTREPGEGRQESADTGGLRKQSAA
jgi:hypothetical protein